MCFLPFTLGNWFVKSYLLLMLLSPALNLLVERATRREFQVFMAAFTLAALVWGCVFPTETAGFNKGLSPLSLVYIYMAGRYLKTQCHPRRSKRFYMCGYLFCSLLIFSGRAAGLSWVLYYCNPVLVLSASSLFLFFVKLDIGHSRFINWVATSVFAAFILHTHTPVVAWLQSYNLEKLHTLPYAEYLPLMFLVLAGVFAVAVLMDKVRAFIFRPLIDFSKRVVISTNPNDKFITVNTKETR